MVDFGGNAARRLVVSALVVASMLVGQSILGTAPPAVAAPAPSRVIPSNTPAGLQAGRILQIIDSRRSPTLAESLTMSDPRVTATLWPQTLGDVLVAWQGSGPYRVVSSAPGPDREVVRLLTARGIPAVLTVHVDAVGLIDGITMKPEVPAVHDWRDVDLALAGVGGRRALLAAGVRDGKCAPVFDDGADATLPLGSTFKLYVLGALAEAIKSGAVHWDDQLTITSGLKSLPTGELQNRPDGSRVTVREAAEKMISISDNTATDLLIDRLGRPRVEAALTQLGNHDPAQLTPFPTTREMFVIGWGEPTLRTQWRDAGEQQRRRMLAHVDARPLKVDLAALQSTPVAADHVGWFASAQDLCRAHVALQRLATGPAAPIRDILAANPGVPVDKSKFSYVAYKGGSSPGNLVGSWYVTDTGGRDHVLAFQLASGRPIGIVDENYVFELMQRALGLFGH